MDLDDDLGAPSQVPSRTSRFAPKSSRFKPKPKTESASAAEPQESKPKLEPQQQDVPVSRKEEEAQNSEPPVIVTPKTEPSASNGSLKMEIDSKAEVEAEMNNVPIDENGQEVEEDMVVREIDVYFTPSLDENSKLYVFQYPLRPCWRPYELDERCEEVRVKPMTGEVEVDLSVDYDSNHFDKEEASNMSMKNQVLTSSWKPPQKAGYAVGVLMDNKLHLNPIHAVVQLRPSLAHFTPGGTEKMTNFKSNADVPDESEESKPKKSVGPVKKQNKRVESAVEPKTNDNECWVPLKYHGPKSDFSAGYLERMMAQESSPISFTMSPYEYITSLCPAAGNDSIRLKGSSKRSLLSMPLEERIKKLLCEGPPVHRFVALKHFAPDDSVEDVLRVLQQHALLVQGLWAPKTKLVRPEGGMETLARNYTLLLFSKSSVINNSEIHLPAKIKDAVKEILKTIAVARPSFDDWRFKEQTDESFIKLYPHIVEKQREVWAAIETEVTNYFNSRGMPGTKVAPKKPGAPEKLVESDKSATKSKSRVPSERGTMTAETREALLKALPKVLHTHKVCSFQLICQGLRDLAVSQATLPKADHRIAVAAANGIEAPREELEEVLSQCTINIHGFYVLKSSSEHPEYDPLRKVVIDLLLGQGPNAKLKKAEVSHAARLALKREFTSIEYNKVMTELCESKGSAWVLKSGDGRPK
ncbi:SIN-like family protein putative isoform 1 [Tripterygium wilfordii]|uniref:SIN-like family protein putative isoform 1 n=1 Tax=Tripterygium wilfordii TaxID=458696 RepID=A0A7J7CPP5_TRIWF|nr:DNA-directed RNA polymerase III subunit RPC5 [Tripterygium wilfordii]KAF5736057.1 SIN-like family protein putative isoform 1 [Tripterygium wilfordii]